MQLEILDVLYNDMISNATDYYSLLELYLLNPTNYKIMAGQRFMGRSSGDDQYSLSSISREGNAYKT